MKSKVITVFGTTLTLSISLSFAQMSPERPISGPVLAAWTRAIKLALPTINMSSTPNLNTLHIAENLSRRLSLQNTETMSYAARVLAPIAQQLKAQGVQPRTIARWQRTKPEEQIQIGKLLSQAIEAHTAYANNQARKIMADLKSGDVGTGKILKDAETAENLVIFQHFYLEETTSRQLREACAILDSLRTKFLGNNFYPLIQEFKKAFQVSAPAPIDTYPVIVQQAGRSSPENLKESRADDIETFNYLLWRVKTAAKNNIGAYKNQELIINGEKMDPNILLSDWEYVDGEWSQAYHDPARSINREWVTKIKKVLDRLLGVYRFQLTALNSHQDATGWVEEEGIKELEQLYQILNALAQNSQSPSPNGDQHPENPPAADIKGTHFKELQEITVILQEIQDPARSFILRDSRTEFIIDGQNVEKEDAAALWNRVYPEWMQLCNWSMSAKEVSRFLKLVRPLLAIYRNHLQEEGGEGRVLARLRGAPKSMPQWAQPLDQLNDLIELLNQIESAALSSRNPPTSTSVPDATEDPTAWDQILNQRPGETVDPYSAEDETSNLLPYLENLNRQAQSYIKHQPQFLSKDTSPEKLSGRWEIALEKARSTFPSDSKSSLDLGKATEPQKEIVALLKILQSSIVNDPHLAQNERIFSTRWVDHVISLLHNIVSPLLPVRSTPDYPTLVRNIRQRINQISSHATSLIQNDSSMNPDKQGLLLGIWNIVLSDMSWAQREPVGFEFPKPALISDILQRMEPLLQHYMVYLDQMGEPTRQQQLTEIQALQKDLRLIAH
ncbi:MAG: hypothetical protein HY399_07395 [Elusimicrobia bacterium]|nr:hypothetical protein [Elusimicrobiota bacterium]